MPKRGLVISGGGVKGAYAVGALYRIMVELGQGFDFAVGTSTGSLIMPFIATGDIGFVRDVYSNVSTGDIFQKVLDDQILTQGCYYSVAPLKNLTEQKISEDCWGRANASPTQICVVTVNFQSGRTVYFHTQPNLVTPPWTDAIRMQSSEDLRRSILASSCEPCFTPSISIPQGNAMHYVDGGVRDYAPIALALLNGVEELTLILLSPEGGHDKGTEQFVDMESVLMRTIELLTDAVGTQNIGGADQTIQSCLYLNALWTGLKGLGVTDADLASLRASAGGVANPFAGFSLNKPPVVIRPSAPLAVDSLTFNQADMRAMIQQGYDRAKAVVG